MICLSVLEMLPANICIGNTSVTVPYNQQDPIQLWLPPNGPKCPMGNHASFLSQEQLPEKVKKNKIKIKIKKNSDQKNWVTRGEDERDTILLNVINS